MNKRPFSRRQFLKVGALGAGLTLSQYLRLHAEQSSSDEKRSAIFIFMEGAPSHQDTFDLKPDAPAEVRGEFKSIPTNVSGVQICEHLPMLAKCADKYAIIRGITHNVADHGLAKKYLLTGNKASQTVSYPEYGSVVSREFPSVPSLATYVSVDESFVGPGYLGSRYSPPDGEQTTPWSSIHRPGHFAGRRTYRGKVSIAEDAPRRPGRRV